MGEIPLQCGSAVNPVRACSNVSWATIRPKRPEGLQYGLATGGANYPRGRGGGGPHLSSHGVCYSVADKNPSTSLMTTSFMLKNETGWGVVRGLVSGQS